MRLRFSLLLLVLGLAGSARADSITIGNSIVNGGQVDTCSNCSYILGQKFGASGLIVSSFTFYSAVASGDIVPLLYTGVANSNGTTTFTLTAIGTDRSITSAGSQTFSFGLTSGSLMTSANTYFGFANLNGANVSFSYTGSASNGGTFLSNQALTLGSTQTFQNSSFNYNSINDLDNRTYSIKATAASLTPEPSSLVLLGTGVLGVIGAARKRFA